MALKYPSFLLIFAFLTASSLFSVSTAFGGRKALAPDGGVLAPPSDPNVAFPPLPDGSVPLNTKDDKVIELAKFAIDEYNKEHGSKLVFAIVFEAISTNALEGTNYGLVVAATENDDLDDYDVNVLVDKDTKKLVSFEKN